MSRADQWLLVHRDLRTPPRIRAVMDQLIDLFQEQKPALAGEIANPGSAPPN